VEVLRRDSPFPHLLIASAIEHDLEQRSLAALAEIRWGLERTDLYRVGVPRAGAALEALVALVSQSACWEAIRELAALQFQCRLAAPAFDLQRYTAGCAIGPHTDAPSEEIRCVINLGAQSSPGADALWIIAADSALVGARRCLPAISACGFAFATGPDSYHALPLVRRGTTYGVIARFARRR
jgi:hypothetical protein